MLPLLLTAVLLQEPPVVTIPRVNKGYYQPAVDSYEKAEAQIESDPAGAIEELTRILDNSKITHLERRLRIEVRPSEYSEVKSFYPLQLRGRAAMNLAAKEPRNAEKLLQKAVEDLQRSVEKGLNSSEGLLKEARVKLEKVRATGTTGPAESPLQKFRRKWDELLDAGDFSGAKGYLESEGGALTSENRTSLLKEVHDKCTAQLRTQALEFRKRLGDALAENLQAFYDMTEEEAEALLTAPSPERMVVTWPALDWMRALAQTLREAHKKKSASPAALLKRCEEAIPLEKGANPWFKLAEGLAFEASKRDLAAVLDRARDARADRRKTEEEQAGQIAGMWKSFAARLDEPFRKSHPFITGHAAELQRVVLRFPRELMELNAVNPEAALASDEPEQELRKLAEGLGRLNVEEGITVESRQKYHTLSVVVTALLGFLEGKGETAIVDSVRDRGAALKGLGGPLEPDRFGPRVRKVFDEVLK